MIRRAISPFLSFAMISSFGFHGVHASEDEFWGWFLSREAEFATLFSYETRAAAKDDAAIQKRTEEVVREMGDRLRKVHPEFSPFIGSSDGKSRLMITVHGQAEHFDAVVDFVATAPKIDGWTFIALKQPMQLSAATEIRSGTATLKVGDWHYSKSKNNEGTFDFEIFIPNKVSDDPDGFQRLFQRITVDFLGERFASTAVGEITVRQMGACTGQDLLPFVDIHEDVRRAIEGG